MFLHVSVIHSVDGGGVRGCSGGGGLRGCSGEHAWLLRGHAWLLLGGMRGCLGRLHGFSGGHAWLLRGVCVVALGGAWLLPGGVHGCSGVCGFSGGSMHGCSGGGHAWDTMRYADTVNEWAVHILLECILVLQASVILSMVGDGVGLASQHASQVI